MFIFLFDSLKTGISERVFNRARRLARGQNSSKKIRPPDWLSCDRYK